MRIGIFTDTYLPDINAVASSSFILRNELVRQGHEVLVVTTELKKGDQYEDVGNVYRLSGIEIKQLYDYRLAQFFSLKAMNYIKDMHLDVIHVQTEFSVGIFGKIVAHILNIPVVYTYHTQYEDYVHYAPVIGNMEPMQPILKKMVSKISQIYGDNCTEMIVPSEKTRAMVAGYGVDKEIHVVPTGLELHRFEKHQLDEKILHDVKEECCIKESDFTLIFLGRIAPEKSIDLVISSLPSVIEKNPHVRLVVVGGGPGLDDLKTLANSLQLDNHVYFAGAKPSDLVPYYYHACDAFVSASVSETQGLTYIEAMAASLPVLARYDKNLEGIIQNDQNGYFFENQEECSSLILKLSQMDLTEMKRRAYQDSRAYSSETFGKKVLGVYEKAIIHKHYTYTIDHIVPKANALCEVILKFDQQTIMMTLPEKYILSHQLEEGQIVDRESFDEMQTYELVLKGYHQALKFLTIKDYTKKQMKEKLLQKGEYEDSQIKIILNLLEEKNLINDESFAKDFIHQAKTRHLGFKRVLDQLKEKGVQDEILEKVKDNYSYELELQKAIEIVKKIIYTNQTKPKQALMKKIRDKLFVNGFDYEVIQEAIDAVEFPENKELETEILNRELNKAIKKYSNRYTGKELNQKILIYLSRKGFEYAQIKEALDERINENDN